jgi:hypothetical protein
MKDIFNDDNKKKKGQGFTILSGDSTDGHGGYGVGALNLNNVTPIFVGPEDGEAFIDMGALHARSSIEKRMKFIPNREEVPNGKLYWLVWVTVDRGENGPYYAGVTGCEMLVDADARRGYKSMPEHVNRMDKSMKKHVIVEHMDEKSKALLGQFLKNHNEELWKNSTDQLKKELLMGEE